MTGTRIETAIEELVAAIDAACVPSATEADMVAALRAYGAARDRVDAAGVQLIAAMGRRGVFTAHGYTRADYAVADLLGWDRRPARRRVQVAEQVCERVSVCGEALPPLLAATGAVFTDGRISVAHAEAIAAVLDSPAARRLDPGVWAGAEEQIAAYAASTGATPGDVTGWARQLIDALDQDGPEPAPEPEQINELHLTRDRTGTGGRVRGELDGPTFDALATAIDALSKPLPEDTRWLGRRQADALGDICQQVMTQGDLPDTGGERPQLRVTLDYDQLQNAVAGATLDTGAWYSPSQLRMLACDCAIIPAVLGSTGEPLDIGRASRVIPTGLRRAVAIRDRGCAYPGCHRPPSWCDVHHCTPWAEGGETALCNSVMLCRAHHTILHNTGWQVRIRDGHPEFTPPTFIDPHRRPRRRPLLV